MTKEPARLPPEMVHATGAATTPAALVTVHVPASDKLQLLPENEITVPGTPLVGESETVAEGEPTVKGAFANSPVEVKVRKR